MSLSIAQIRELVKAKEDKPREQDFVGYLEKLTPQKNGSIYVTFNIDGSWPDGNSKTVSVFYDGKQWNCSYWNKLKREKETFTGDLPGMEQCLTRLGVMSEIYRNNHVDRISAATKNRIDKQLADETARLYQEEKDQTAIKKDLAIKKHIVDQIIEGSDPTVYSTIKRKSSFALLQGVKSTRVISIACTEFCKNNDVDTPVDDLDDSAYPPKTFPVIIIEAVCRYLVEVHKASLETVL
jgi:hypothetical protein